MSDYTETELQLILNKITTAQASTMTMNEGELYLAPDNAVYSVNNVTPVNGNVTLEVANKDLSNLSSTGEAKFQAPITGGASSITSSNLTTNRALVSDTRGKVAVSSVTSTQLGYLSTVTSNVQTQLNGKQATISDLATIRSGAALGTTALQSIDNDMVINALGFTPYSAANPNGYTSNVGTVTSVNNVQPVNGNVTLSIPAAQVNSDWNATSGLAQILNKPNLATVATSGSYNDLSNKPTIPDTSNLANKDLSNLTTTGNAKFQAPLVSGTNIKTINSTSLLGNGNINVADTTLSNVASINANSAVQTALDGKVSKTGDTMTGTLTIVDDLGGGVSTGMGLFLKSDVITQSVIPPSNLYSPYIQFLDTNGNLLADMYYRQGANGTKRLNLACRNADGSETAYLNMGFQADGSQYCAFPNSPCVDGQWVNSVTAIVGSRDLATGSYSFSVNSYLPNDGEKYEMLVHGYLTLSSSASTGSYVTVSSDIYAPTYTTASFAQLVTTTDARAMANDLIIPVGTSRKVNYTVAGTTANSLYLRAYAYRRIGTNS